MSSCSLARVAGLVLIATVLPLTASAQVYGTFPWQMQPYCNVVTLTLSATPAGFTLDGTDNQCGTTNKGSAVGVASFNATGNVTLNFSIVTAPAGKAVHVSAVVSPANGSGTWTDSVGNSGTFAFFGNVPGLPVRPFPTSGLPPAIITSVELANNAVTGATVVNGSLTSADFSDAPRTASVEGISTTLAPSDSVVMQLTLTAPASGVILANATGSFYMTSGATLDTARCSLTTGLAFDINQMAYAREFGNTSYYGLPFGLTRSFPVAAGSSTTVRLVCNAFSGSVDILSPSMTALFVAQ